MFNIFPSFDKNEITKANHYSGQTIAFNDLIDRIRQPNDKVTEARLYKSIGDDENYKRIKSQWLPAFFVNGYNDHNTRSPKVYYTSTGYIYLDIDGYKTVDELEADKSLFIARYSFISAIWTSTSGKGLAILVKVDPTKCNKYQYLKYWDALNDLFKNQIDRRTRNFTNLCVLSSDPNVYVNVDASPINELITIDYENGLAYETPVPLEKFESIYKPVVYPEGIEVLKVDFYKYKFKKVEIKYRTSTIGAICLQLMYLNRQANPKQILNALFSFNKHYTAKPLSKKEVENIFKSNWSHLANIESVLMDAQQRNIDNGKQPYFKRKYVFFHPGARMPKPVKDAIRGEEMRKLKSKQIGDCIDNLINEVKPKKITATIISEYTGIPTSTVYRFLSDHSKAITEYNQNQKRYHKNDTFSHGHIYKLRYNMQQREKVSKKVSLTVQEIYEAIEECQDNVNKIDQKRIASHIGKSLITVKRNWLPEIKSLVKAYNKGVKENVKSMVT